MSKTRNADRYQQLSPEDMAVIRESLTPRVMRYAIRGNLVDTWRIRFFMKIAIRGARMNADPKDIEKAMLDWVKAPSPGSLEQAERELVVAGMGYDESAVDSDLSADELEEMHANLAHIGDKAEGLMYDPGTYREIEQHGAKRGMDNVYKKGIRHAFGLPENALKGRDAPRLLDKVADVQKDNLDKFLSRPDFWEDLDKLEKGRLTRDELRTRWQGDGPPLLQPAEPPPPPPPAKPKPKRKKPRRRIDLDPMVINGKVRTVDHDEVAVWYDDEQTRPMIVNRYYTDGTMDILIGDGHGGLMLCHEDRWAMSRGNNVQPVVVQRRLGCYRVPSSGSAKRSRGPVGND